MPDCESGPNRPSNWSMSQAYNACSAGAVTSTLTLTNSESLLFISKLKKLFMMVLVGELIP